MNRVFAAALSVPKACARRLSTTGARCGRTDLSSIKKKQKHFEVGNDDVPVYLKGGAMDYGLFLVTVGLITLSLASAFRTTYNLATKK